MGKKGARAVTTTMAVETTLKITSRWFKLHRYYSISFNSSIVKEFPGVELSETASNFTKKGELVVQ